MPSDPKPHHRRAAAEALLDGVTLSARDIERLESWYESGDLASLRGAFPGYVVSNLTRVAQAIADAEERGRQGEVALIVELEGLTDAAEELCTWDWTPLVEGSKHGDALVQDAKNLEMRILRVREFLAARAALESKP